MNPPPNCPTLIIKYPNQVGHIFVQYYLHPIQYISLIDSCMHTFTIFLLYFFRETWLWLLTVFSLRLHVISRPLLGLPSLGCGQIASFKLPIQPPSSHSTCSKTFYLGTYAMLLAPKKREIFFLLFVADLDLISGCYFQFFPSSMSCWCLRLLHRIACRPVYPVKVKKKKD